MGLKSAILLRTSQSGGILCGIRTRFSFWEAWHEAETSIALPDFTPAYTVTDACGLSVGFGLIQRSQIRLTSLDAWRSWCHPAPGSTALIYSDCRNTGCCGSRSFPPVWVSTQDVLPNLETRLDYFFKVFLVRFYYLWAWQRKKYHRSSRLLCLVKAFHKNSEVWWTSFWIIEMALCDMGWKKEVCSLITSVLIRCLPLFEFSDSRN